MTLKWRRLGKSIEGISMDKKKFLQSKRMLLLLLGCLFLFSGCSLANASASDSKELDLNNPDTRIAVEIGTVTEAAAREAFPDAKYISVPDLSNGFLAVTSGKADSFAVDKSAFESYIKSGGTELSVYGDTTIGEAGKVAVGISPSARIPDAEEKINLFLAEMREDGILDDMRQRWVVSHDYVMPEITVPENPEFTITVGTTGLMEPYTFYKGTEIIGFDVELMRRFAQWCNAELVIVHKVPKDGT